MNDIKNIYNNLTMQDGTEPLKFWGSYFLNLMVLFIDVPLAVKWVLTACAGLLTIVSLLNQIDIMISKVPGWKLYWKVTVKRIINKKKIK